MPRGSLIQIMMHCGLGLSDLSKRPLLHILQLVSPLEPKERVETHVSKLKFTKDLGLSVCGHITWLVLGVQSGSSSADS